DRIIDGARVAGVKYVMVIGGDGVIPFRRYPDRTPFGNERQFAPILKDPSASKAVLALGYFMSQDVYGSVLSVNRGDHLFPIPDLPVGRLVETAPEITGQLQAFTGTLTIQKRPVAVGYDFMADGARETRDEFDLATGGGTLATERQVTTTINGAST